MFFEWVYPKYIDIIAKSAAIFYDQPDVTSPLLRFAIQMASNKRGRLNFECSSANGILLFRELSKIVMEYGSFPSLYFIFFWIFIITLIIIIYIILLLLLLLLILLSS